MAFSDAFRFAAGTCVVAPGVPLDPRWLGCTGREIRLERFIDAKDVYDAVKPLIDSGSEFGSVVLNAFPPLFWLHHENVAKALGRLWGLCAGGAWFCVPCLTELEVAPVHRSSHALDAACFWYAVKTVYTDAAGEYGFRPYLDIPRWGETSYRMIYNNLPGDGHNPMRIDCLRDYYDGDVERVTWSPAAVTRDFVTQWLPEIGRHRAAAAIQRAWRAACDPNLPYGNDLLRRRALAFGLEPAI